MLKLFKPYVSWRSRFLALRVLMGTQLAEGPMVKKLESEFERIFGISNALAVNSGTSALELAYDLAGIGDGDEVITPVFTCTATNVPLVRRKAKIIFADIDIETLNVASWDVLQKMTPKTKAIVFVAFGGNINSIQKLIEIVRRKNKKVKIIVDAAQAIEFNYPADYIAVSLQAIKTITAGDGGMLIVKDFEDYKKAKRLRWFGIDRAMKQKFGDVDAFEAGYKFHMNDLAAAVAVGNLRSFPKLRKKIIERQELYYSLLRIPMICGTWACVALVPTRRDELIQFLKDNGVEAGLHHYRNDKYTVFKKFKGRFPNMDIIDRKYVLLPHHYGIKRSHIKRICYLVNWFYGHYEIG